jgi:hypothetical protein
MSTLDRLRGIDRDHQKRCQLSMAGVRRTAIRFLILAFRLFDPPQFLP